MIEAVIIAVSAFIICGVAVLAVVWITNFMMRRER